MDYYVLIVARMPKIYGGPTFCSKYDMSAACNHCGAGARLDGKLILEKPPSGQGIYPTYDDDRSEFSGLHVLATYECFGNSGLNDPFYNSSFANPQIIISQVVVDALQRYSSRYLRFIPIQIIN